MKLFRSIVFSFVLVLILGLFASSSFAGSTIVYGEFTADSPTWTRPKGPGEGSGNHEDRGICNGGPSRTARLQLYTFHVTVSGSYTIDMIYDLSPDEDNNLILYSPEVPFNTYGGRCLAMSEDRNGDYRPILILDLEANVTYTLAVSTYDEPYAGNIGAFAIEFRGVGDIILGSSTFADGRLNNRDAAAPVVVYMREDGLSIFSDAGVEILFVSVDDLEAAGDCPGSNVLIASNASVAVYRLSSCEFQINAPMYNGKTYVMIFASLDATDYVSYELE